MWRNVLFPLVFQTLCFVRAIPQLQNLAPLGGNRRPGFYSTDSLNPTVNFQNCGQTQCSQTNFRKRREDEGTARVQDVISEGKKKRKVVPVSRARVDHRV